MVQRSARPCAAAGCSRLTLRGRCEEHRLALVAEKRAALEEDRPAWRKLYGRRWRAYAQDFLRRFPLCGMRFDGEISREHSRCAREGRKVQAKAVDHVKRHEGDLGLFWDHHNHQSLCKGCHDEKTARERSALARQARLEPEGERTDFIDSIGTGSQPFITVVS